MSDSLNLELNSYDESVRGAPHMELPVLDLSLLDSPDLSNVESLAISLRDIISQIGFLCIVNHKVSEKVIAKMTEFSENFFLLPVEEKESLAINRHERGYTAINIEVIEDNAIGGSSRNDLNESFNFGVEYPPDDPRVISGKRMYAANVWPKSIPEFSSVAKSYIFEMERLSKRLLPVWAIALGLKPNYFDCLFDSAHSYVRTIRYPSRPYLEKEELGIRSHSDTSFVTLLPPENEIGLQVMDENGTWFWPDCPPGGIIVNFGMYLERLSNGVVRATPHRVIPPISGTRYSMPFFMCPNLEAVIECLPTCYSSTNPPKYKPESFWSFHTNHMSKIYPHFAAKEDEL